MSHQISALIVAGFPCVLFHYCRLNGAVNIIGTYYLDCEIMDFTYFRLAGTFIDETQENHIGELGRLPSAVRH